MDAQWLSDFQKRAVEERAAEAKAKAKRAEEANEKILWIAPSTSTIRRRPLEGLISRRAG